MNRSVRTVLNRLAQTVLILLGLFFFFAAFKAVAQPWRQLHGGTLAGTILGHLVALILCLLCFKAADRFGRNAKLSR